MPGQLTRSQVPVEETCDLGHIYPSRATWEEDLRWVEAALPALEAYRGHLGESAATLLAFVRERDTVGTRYEKVLAYADTYLSMDGTSAENQAMAGRAYAMAARLGASLAYASDELLDLNPDQLAAFVAEEPALATYWPQFEALGVRRGHLLGARTEQALAALDEAIELPYTLWQRVTTADLVCPAIVDESGAQTPVTIARYQFGFSRSANPTVRREAYEALAAGLGNHQHTLATTLGTHVKRNVDLARLRGYGSAVEMMLGPERVPETVYRTILREVHDGMAPHVRRLIDLRCRLLGIERMHHYDLHAPFDPEFNPAIDFDQARGVILEGLSPLGEEYVGIVAQAFAGRWIDRADNVGKRSGAWSMPLYDVHPYVFVTWQDNWRSLLILAHELGHAAHAALGARSQIISNTWGISSGLTGAGGNRFFVEGPSTSAEMLVGHHVLATTQEVRLRRLLVEQFLGTFTHNMVTHLLEAHFLQRLYDLAEADEPITTAAVLAAQGEVFARFYGDAVVPDEAANLYWMQQPHFYMGLYPYTYSAGLSLGFNVAENIGREGQPAAERWLKALRAGATLPPLGLAELAGIDLTSPEPLRRTVAYFGSLVDELAASYG